MKSIRRLLRHDDGTKKTVMMDFSTGEDGSKDSLEDYPTSPHKAAAANGLKSFVSLLGINSSQLTLGDRNGWTPLHHACHNASMDVLLVILQHKPDLNALTNKGDTALHLAVAAGHCVVIELLVQHGADGSIKNDKQLTPVHLAVQLQKHDCLRSILKDDKVSPEVEGELKTVPLHLAACLDDVVSVQILLDHGAYMCKRCSLGLSALHFAAKNASKNVLNLFLELAEAKGYSRDIVLSFEDKYKHSPLHLAINSGNIEPVKVCLEAGAHIDSKQEDGSTPVHLVCTQPGVLEILKLMCRSQPKRFKACMDSADASGMTPLHRAALFDYSDVAEYLIKQGSPLNKKDSSGKTPLLLASSRQCWATLRVLFNAGSDLAARDFEMSNFLHLAIRTGADMAEIWNCRSKCDIGSKMLNESDIHGCTPLHYASKAGNMPSIVTLLQEGAVITCKNNSKESPLHFASRFGRVNTCRTLLDSMQGPFVVNEADGEGLTSLHLASQAGHVKVVALLMQRGALLHRDHEGNTPLHLAAKNGFTQTMKLLLNVHPSLLNSDNNDGNTPLHEASIANKPKSITLLLTMDGNITQNQENRTFLDIAIERSHQDATQAVINHKRWKEILLLPTQVLGSYTLGMVQYLPDMCVAVLDNCMEKSPHDPISSEYNVTYHFDLIRTVPDAAPCKQDLPVDDIVQQSKLPMSTLISMVRYQRVHCLSHPVCLRFVKMKWGAVGFWMHFMNLLVYGMYLACLTSVVIMMGPLPLASHAINATNSTNATSSIYPATPGVTYQAAMQEYNTKRVSSMPLLLMVLAFVGINVLKEFVQFSQTKLRYFQGLPNLIEWGMHTCTTLYIVSLLLNMGVDWAYNCGAIGLFLSWINLLLILQRFEFFGIYVVMFREILGTLLQVLIVFSILIFAFGVTFYALLKNELSGGYTTVPLGVFSTIVMMVGDMNYLDTFVRPHNDLDPNTSHYSSTAFFIMSLFLLFIPILLMNLLIGLAVGDIEGVQKNARLKRLAMQVQLSANMEKMMPAFLQTKINKKMLTEFPNSSCSSLEKWYAGLVGAADKDGRGTAVADHLHEQVMQQKARLKNLQTDIQAQTELLKLVVARMEIQTESSTMDEGCRDEGMDIAIILKQAASKTNRWKSKTIGGAVKSSQVVDLWRREGGALPCPGEDESGNYRRCITPVDSSHIQTKP